MFKSRFLTCFTVLFIVFCLSSAGLWFLSTDINRRARVLYGPPSSEISISRRILLQGYLLVNQDNLTRPTDIVGAEQTFVIPQGETTAGILGRLWEAGLIPDPAALRSYLQYTGLDTSLQAGEYALNTAMSPIEIARELQDATPSEVNFSVLPGWRLEEIAASIPTSGLVIHPDEFLLAASQIPEDLPIYTQLPETASVEGFLSPGTLKLSRETTANQLVRLFVNQFQESISVKILEGFERQGLTLYEAVTLASIVERESKVDEEKPMIASVYLNRLNIGMKLDADPTVQYAVGFDKNRGGWWPIPVSLADLEINSPYNTYLYSGLPPSPIANPSIQSLRAVAFPAQTPYFYFRAACDESGKHVFAETYPEHLNNACP
jgi:UPF0755 protein